MEKGNVLVIGNSGVGKSTLINAVLGDERAKTGWGAGNGTTDKLTIYENDKVPFRLVDTVGFEPSLIREHKAIGAVKQWSKESAKQGQEEKQINVIWFCIDGTSSKLFPQTIKALSKATSIWNTVPVIVVITKSYSVPDREINIQMVHNAFANQKRYTSNLREVIPVVASTYVLNDTAYAPPEGISDLIETTNALMPEGIKAGENDISTYVLSRKRALAQGVVAVATSSGVIVGAVPIPIADAFVLSPIELAEVNSIAKIYDIENTEESKRFINSIVEVGTVSATAKAVISALKAIPGINLGAGIVNAIIAGSIIVALGEGSIYAFEQVYLGKKSVTDIDWVKKVMESKFSSQFQETVKTIADKMAENMDKQKIKEIIVETFSNQINEKKNSL